MFRGFERFSEVFRGFQRFSEVLRDFQRVFQGPLRAPLMPIFLSELRVVLPLIVLPLKTPTKFEIAAKNRWRFESLQTAKLRFNTPKEMIKELMLMFETAVYLVLSVTPSPTSKQL